ncbi:DUF4174 domain-containing protein [Sphingomonas sp. LR60]|uniref:DUF4174 domain-containing protein n=1 Tax=Sphingomonas sp. LR60 TaxID=3050233 RepID=UPI002FE16D25
MLARLLPMTMPILLSVLSLAAATPTSLSALQWEKRVLLISAPAEQDRWLHEQRLIMTRWKAAAEDRDLQVIEIIGEKVTGVSDAPAMLRKRFNLPSDRFSVVLIGKDGGLKMRQTRPIAAALLEETIDAMPMRRQEKR